MLTSEIARKTSVRPLHFLRESELSSASVSSTSKWFDSVWQLDNPSIGQRKLASRVSWSLNFSDGSNLIEPKNAVLLDWLRRFFWSLFFDHREISKPYKVSNAMLLTQGMRILIPWMHENSITLPHQLSRVSISKFVEDLPALLADESEEELRIGRGVIWMPLRLIELLWRQRAALLDAGYKPMPESPWDKGGANGIVRQVATEAKGWIRPLPDEVAIPIINKAAWFLDKPAEDILRLREGIQRALTARSRKHLDRRLITRPSAVDRQREFADSFNFQVVDEGGNRWHPPLTEFRVGTKFRSIARTRQLVAALTAAACIVIQSSTGMRASELCGLRSGICKRSGLPVGVRVVPSASGLNEVFVLSSPLTKRDGEPRDEEWLLGMRPADSSEIPLPVRAMMILERLLRYERELLGSKRLLVSNRRHGFPKTAETIGEYTSVTHTNAVKKFVRAWVDLTALPDESQHRTAARDLVQWRESRGVIIRPHQFRPTYAHFALAVDSRLLPAVQRQFHHVSMAMTEQGYWGANRTQIEPMNSVSSQLTAMRLYELATGRSRSVGKRGESLSNNVQAIRKLTDGLSLDAGWRAVVRFVRQNGLSIWFAPHGDCFPEDVSSMECHKLAQTRPLGRPMPNLATRNPTICSGCRSYIVDLRHRGFHERRYVESVQAIALAKKLGLQGQFRIATARARASARLLSMMGIDSKALAELVASQESNS